MGICPNNRVALLPTFILQPLSPLLPCSNTDRFRNFQKNNPSHTKDPVCYGLSAILVSREEDLTQIATVIYFIHCSQLATHHCSKSETAWVIQCLICSKEPGIDWVTYQLTPPNLFLYLHLPKLLCNLKSISRIVLDCYNNLSL